MLVVREIFLYLILSITFFNVYYKYLSKFVIDKPVKRSSHKKNIPTSGGVLFIIIHLINVFLNNKYNLLILIPIGLIGFLDDLFNVKQIYRLVFQIINILLISFFYIKFDIFQELNLSFLFFLFISLIVGLIIINCINFMDGIDGLVASSIFIIFLNYSFFNQFQFLGVLCSILIFLFYNWSPAKLFMGDSGSTFLGIILFYIIFTSPNINDLLIMLLTASPLLLDSLICILRRFINNENIFTPHKKHLYQRLNQRGMSHEKVTLIYFFATLILLIFSHTGSLIIMSFLTLLVFVFGIFLEKKYALPFKI